MNQRYSTVQPRFSKENDGGKQQLKAEEYSNGVKQRQNYNKLMALNIDPRLT